MSGFATLDPTASDTAGGSIGIDLLGDDLDRQLLLEVSYLTPHGSQNALVPDDQYAIGTRYQFPISNSTLLRFDTMYGWREGLRATECDVEGGDLRVAEGVYATDAYNISAQ